MTLVLLTHASPGQAETHLRRASRHEGGRVAEILPALPAVHAAFQIPDVLFNKAYFLRPAAAAAASP
jgi:hypothetical protein